eukprot:5372748-Ditylum_brightwellii.AAC.1
MRIDTNSEIDLSKEEEKKDKPEVNELIEIDLTSNDTDSKSESSKETDDEKKAAEDNEEEQDQENEMIESVYNKEEPKVKDLPGEEDKEKKDNKNTEKNKNNDSFVFLFNEGEIKELAKEKPNILFRHIGKWQTKLISAKE